jgi:hypothetical protein
MAQVLITGDDGRVLFDGTISMQHAYDLSELIKEEFMAKEWTDVPEEELGLETEEAIEEIREEEGYQEVPKGFPVMQRRRLKSAIARLAKVEEKLEIEDWDDGGCATKKYRKVYPGDEKGRKHA